MNLVKWSEKHNFKVGSYIVFIKKFYIAFIEKNARKTKSVNL